jgi:hypothetical protein
MIQSVRPKSIETRRFLSMDTKNAVKKEVRFYSNQRPRGLSKPSNTCLRVPLAEIHREKATRYYRLNSGIPQSTLRLQTSAVQDLVPNYLKHKIPHKYFENLSQDSLIIESLAAVPKGKRLHPIREHLIRLLNPSKRQDKAIMHFEIPNQINDYFANSEAETPSPVIKAKYKHIE